MGRRETNAKISALDFPFHNQLLYFIHLLIGQLATTVLAVREKDGRDVSHTRVLI